MGFGIKKAQAAQMAAASAARANGQYGPQQGQYVQYGYPSPGQGGAMHVAPVGRTLVPATPMVRTAVLIVMGEMKGGSKDGWARASPPVRLVALVDERCVPMHVHARPHKRLVSTHARARVRACVRRSAAPSA